jgi:hypothetical protein
VGSGGREGRKEGGKEGGRGGQVLIYALADAVCTFSMSSPYPFLTSSHCCCSSSSSSLTHTVVDLEAFGFHGSEPSAVSGLRKLMKDTEPALYKLILTDDKIAQKFMADPSAAYREAQAISPALAEAAKVLAAGGTRK